MRVLELAASLRSGACARSVGAQLLEHLAAARSPPPAAAAATATASGAGASPGPPPRATPPRPPSLDDAAALAQRLARQARPPPRVFFDELADHFRSALDGGGASGRGGATVSAVGVALLADALARARCGEECPSEGAAGVLGALGLACLSAVGRQGGCAMAALAPHDLLQLARACAALGAQRNDALRAFLLMQVKSTASRMEACVQAESAAVFAAMQIYSEELSAAVEYRLTANPWGFDLRDVKHLLVHFRTWSLGAVQKKAFQRLAQRIADNAEHLSPQDALEALQTYAAVGSANEVLLQHLYLRLLLDRSFAELPPDRIAQLAGSMAQVQYYHTGLLREIVAHIGEEHQLVASWSPAHIYGALRSFGLAPVEVPPGTLGLLGCRYGALVWSGGAGADLDLATLRGFFEVASHYPQLLGSLLARGAARRLTALVQAAARTWGPRPCADVLLATALARAQPPGRRGQGSEPCACASAEPPSSSLGSRWAFRTPQPEGQLRVILKASRHFRQRSHPGKKGFKVRVARSDVPSRSSFDQLYIADDPERDAAPRVGPSRCHSAWALPGRTSRQARLPSRDELALPLLLAMLPTLLESLEASGQELSELPGAPAAAELLQLEAPQSQETIGGSSVSVAELLGVPPSPPAAGEQASAPLSVAAPCSPPVPSRAPSEPQAAAGASGAPDASAASGQLQDPEAMRRSEFLQVCIQTLAALQIWLAPGAGSRELEAALPLQRCRIMTRLLELVEHVLRPRRSDDETVRRYHLGPQRLEAFVRRPEEQLVGEVYTAIRGIFPFLPHSLGWATWNPRRQDHLRGEPTGGAHVAVNKEVEVPPFVICILLQRRPPGAVRGVSPAGPAGLLEEVV